MNDPLDHVIFFFGSGFAFFVGVGGIVVALILSLRARSRMTALARNLCVLLGCVLVLLSAAPLEWWLYALAGTTTFIWLALEWTKALCSRRTMVAARVAVLAVWLLALAFEMSYQVTPPLPALEKPVLFVIGDSVSAGMSDADKGTWPRRLAEQHSVEVRDFSRMGATVKSARKQAKAMGDMPGLVLLEIGGNDLLGTTSAADFEEQLDLLLADVCRADRTVIMLALPLPPLMNRFGLAQRRLARKYDVLLIPQRIFASLLTTRGATVDGIHLTPHGHQTMSDTIWELVRLSYE